MMYGEQMNTQIVNLCQAIFGILNYIPTPRAPRRASSGRLAALGCANLICVPSLALSCVWTHEQDLRRTILWDKVGDRDLSSRRLGRSI